MGDKAARICEAKFGLLWICRDGRFQVAEIHPYAASSFNSYLTVATARQHMAYRLRPTQKALAMV